jgi:hypothetical protein
MAILILINSLNIGGAEKVAKFLNDQIPSKIITLEGDLSKDSMQTPVIIKFLHIPYYVYKLVPLLKDGDIIISHLERANFVAILVKLFRKVKVISTVHTNVDEYYKGIFGFGVKFAWKILSKFSDKIVVVSNGINKYNGIVIYPAVDISEYKNVGRTVFEKGQWFLIRMIKYLDKKLVIVGSGNLYEYLSKLSLSLGLKTYTPDKEFNLDYDVYLLGKVDNPFSLLYNSKIFISTSLVEGLPISMIEALGTGNLVISSDCKSGPREILAPNTDYLQITKPEFAEYGILMPVLPSKLLSNEPITEREKLWIDSLKEILQDQNLIEKYRKKAPIRAKDFSKEKIIQKWKEVIYS